MADEKVAEADSPLTKMDVEPLVYPGTRYCDICWNAGIKTPADYQVKDTTEVITEYEWVCPSCYLQMEESP